MALHVDILPFRISSFRVKNIHIRRKDSYFTQTKVSLIALPDKLQGSNKTADLTHKGH